MREKPGPKGGSILTNELLAEMRAHPGRWLIVKRYTDPLRGCSRARSVVHAWSKKHPDFEFAVEAHPLAWIAYARYPAHEDVRAEPVPIPQPGSSKPKP